MTEDEVQENILERMMLHQVNAEAKTLNTGIVQKTSALQDIPIDTEIYKPQQQIQPPAHEQPAQPIQPIQPQQQIVRQDLSPLIDRVTSLEKQVTKFVNLIERNVAKNAKEITIRIKLNENNDSTNSK
jgi:hypothetical protein